VIHGLVLVASLSSAIPAGTEGDSLWVGSLCTDPRLESLNGDLPASNTSVRALRGKYRPIGLDVPEGPKPSLVTLGLSDSPESPLYAGIYWLEREHVSPPSTGPPRAEVHVRRPLPHLLRKPP